MEVQQEPNGSARTLAYDRRKLDIVIGSGEFHLLRQGSQDVKLVVRTINSSAFSKADWDEYVATVSLFAVGRRRLKLLPLGPISLRHQKPRIMVLVQIMGRYQAFGMRLLGFDRLATMGLWEVR